LCRWGHEFDRQAGMRFAEPREDGRQQKARHNLRRGQAEWCRSGAGLPRCLKLQGLRGLLHRAVMRQETAEQFRGAEPAGMPVEERAAQSGLRRADLSTEGWLAEPICRAAAEREP
jgi:hypothetical protein